MKINVSGGLDQYKSYVNTMKSCDPALKSSTLDRAGAANTDTVSISGDAAARAEASRVAARMSSQVQQEPAARMEALSAAVADGSYSVPAGQIADAILNLKV